jgi:predicted  nucleic acid-binding Zn-ribbon protein
VAKEVIEPGPETGFNSHQQHGEMGVVAEQTDYLAGLMGSIDEAYSKAEAEVTDARKRLQEAEARFETVKALKAIKDGSKGQPAKRQATNGAATPRSSKEEGRALQDRIVAAIREAGDGGLPVADLIEKVVPGADRQGGQRVRNQLSVMTKAQKIKRGDNSIYTLG